MSNDLAVSVGPVADLGDADGGDAGDLVASLEYPRIASYYIETYVDDATVATMAKSDVVIVDAESAAIDRTPLDALRAASPAASLLAYLTSEEIAREPNPTDQPLATARFAKIQPKEWLLEPGSTLAADVTASATKLTVAAGSAFTVKRPASDFYDDSEPTYVFVDGEHMQLTAVNGNTLTVKRGYKSTAAAHTAGTRAASHVVFFAGTWMLNLAADVGWREQLTTEAGSLVSAGPWNGLFLDVCFEDISWLNGGLLDVDADGKADDPTVASMEWSTGMGKLVDAARSRLGPTVPIMANPGGQDCPHPNLDGILLEGWPIGQPPGNIDFTAALARYESWSLTAGATGKHMTVANGYSPKIGFGTIKPGDDAAAQVDYAAMRFGLGVALMGDGLYTFDNGVFGHYVAWYYDEYDGAGIGTHWLGRPLGAPSIQGDAQLRAFENGLVVVNMGTAAVEVIVPSGYTRLSGTQDPMHNNGAAVTDTLSVATSDAYLLRRTP